MLKVKIDSSITIVQNPTIECQWTIKTPLAFGDIYATQKKHLPDNTPVQDFLVYNIITGIQSDTDQSFYWMFGLKERGGTLLSMDDFLEEYDGTSIDTKSVDNLRREHRMTAYPSYNSLFDNDTLICSDLHSSFEVVICILYYYASNGYRLQKCRHCGKWFAVNATRNNGNKQYCNRLSPYPGYEDVTCEKAHIDISNNLKHKRRRIKGKLQEFLYVKERVKSEWKVFNNQYQNYEKRIKESASVELLSEYQDYLDSVTDKLVEWGIQKYRSKKTAIRK